jgi:primosomal protein N' (replication factor Y)
MLAAFLLHGVTGNGKTEVYLQAIAYALEQGKGAIVLVPEIS